MSLTHAACPTTQHGTAHAGASRGIGAAIAEYYAREGGKLIITADPGQEEGLEKVSRVHTRSITHPHTYSLQDVHRGK